MSDSLPPQPPSSGTAPTYVTEPVPPAEPPRRRRGALLVGLGLAIALIAGAVTVALTGGTQLDRGEPTALSLTFAKGDTTRYRLGVQIEAGVDLGAMGEQPMDMDVTQTVAWKVVSVDDEGVATVELSVEDVSGSVNGMDVGANVPTESVQFKIAPDGTVVSMNGVSFGAAGAGMGGPADFGQLPGMGQMTPILPDGEVQPGDSWDKEFSQKFPFGDGKVEYTAHSTFERYEVVDGVEAAVVHTTYDVPFDFSLDFGDFAEALGGSAGKSDADLGSLEISYSGHASVSQRSWLDPDGRDMLRTTSDGTFDMTIGMKGVPEEQAQDFPMDGVTFDGTFRMQLERL